MPLGEYPCLPPQNKANLLNEETEKTTTTTFLGYLSEVCFQTEALPVLLL